MQLTDASSWNGGGAASGQAVPAAAVQPVQQLPGGAGAVPLAVHHPQTLNGAHTNGEVSSDKPVLASEAARQQQQQQRQSVVPAGSRQRASLPTFSPHFPADSEHLHPAKSAHLELLYAGNNSFHCNGRFLLGPGADMFYGTGLTIFIPCAIFIGTTCVFMYQDYVAHGWWIILVACVLLLLTLYYLVRVSTSDPGIFLRLPPEPQYRWHAISQEINLDGRVVQLRYCQQCNIHRPPRCVHCTTCNSTDTSAHALLSGKQSSFGSHEVVCLSCLCRLRGGLRSSVEQEV